MYLTKIGIRDLGPIEKLELEPNFKSSGEPKPILLVGANGGGKTVLLSILAESLIEAAAIKYTRVTPLEAGGRNWYRISGGTSIRAGENGSLCYIELRSSNDQKLTYVEKGGTPDVSTTEEVIPSTLTTSEFKNTTPFKKFAANQQQIQDEFSNGVYCFITSDRREKPSWLNPKLFSQPSRRELTIKQSDDIPNEIIIESALEKIMEWIPTILIEARADVIVHGGITGAPQLTVSPGVNTGVLLRSLKAWEQVLKIFRLIVGDEKAMLGWMGRHAPQAIGYSSDQTGQKPVSLDCLSKGQSSLLGIFLTLLMHADTVHKLDDLSTLSGICLIDEADAHLHTNLQAGTLPRLMALFPRIQFVISTHSPLVAIGIEKEYGACGCQIISMPSGQEVAVSDYSEHKALFDVITATESFVKRAATLRNETTIVLTEGKTDVTYIKSAIKHLGLEKAFEKIIIEEVGSHLPQPCNFGKSGLNNIYKSVSGKSHWLGARLILLYDSDSNKSSIRGRVSIHGIPKNPEGVISNGIENLLPSTVFQDPEILKSLPNAPAGPGSVTLNGDTSKSAICELVCEHHKAALESLRLTLEAILDAAKAPQ
jgi:hypothetical protein